MGEADRPFDRAPHPPRDWQREAYPECLRWLRSGRRGLLYACTGSGKSYLVCAIARRVASTMRDGYCVVIEVPTQALVRQLAADLAKWLPRKDVGAWYGRSKVRKPRRVIVACRDSLGTLAPFLAAHTTRIACLIADEAHRIESATYQAAISAMEPATMMGVTATPYLANDGLEAWDGLIYQYRITRAIEEGVLVPARIITGWGEGTDAVGDAIGAAKEAGPNSIVDCYSIADAEQHAAELRDAGVPAMAVHSKASKEHIERALAAHKAGEVWALCQVDMLSEGVDMPYLRHLLLRRPIGSHVRKIQLLGRVLRSHPGKTHATIWDLTGQLGGYEVDRDAQLGRLEIDAAREARTTTPAARVEQAWEDELARVVARQQTDEWLGGAAVEYGYDPVPASLADDPAPEGMIAEIRRRSRATLWIHADDRESVQRIVARPEGLTRGAAQALIDVLSHGSKEAGKQFARTKSWRDVKVEVRVPGVPSLAVARLTSRVAPKNACTGAGD